MKKRIITAVCAAAVMLSLASCNKEDEQQLTYTSYADIYSLVVPEQGAPVASATRYKFVQDMVNNKISVSTENLNLGGQTVSFTTKEMPMYASYVKVGNENKSLLLFSGEDVSTDQNKIDDIYCEATYASPSNDASLLDQLKVQLTKNPLSRPMQGSESQYVYMEYEYNNYDIYTFWNDMLYSGSMVMESATDPGTSDNGMTLRVKFNIKAGEVITADLYFYNIKLSSAEDAPVMNLAMKNQAVTWVKDGFTIDLKNVKPVNVDETSESAECEFVKFTMQSTDDMKGAAFMLQTGEGVTARYAGRCIYSPSK